VLLAIPLYACAYVVRQNLMHLTSRVLACLYMLFGLAAAQQIVIRGSGMKYRTAYETSGRPSWVEVTAPRDA